MALVSAAVALAATAVLVVLAWAFAPWADNMLGGTALLGVPVWPAAAALAAGTAAVAVDSARRARRG